jgi:hypothetical protein
MIWEGWAAMKRKTLIGSFVLAATCTTATAPTAAASGGPAGQILERDIQVQMPGEIFIRRSPWPGPPSLPTEDNGDLMKPSDLIVGEWRKKLDQLIMPAGPSASGNDMFEVATELAKGCGNAASFRCMEAGAMLEAANAMRKASSASPNCDAAAARFRTIYDDTTVISDIARDYDLACLGSFSLRSGETVVTAATHRPAVLKGAELAGGVLDAVGLLEANGQVQCSGLIRPDRTFITARHCIRGLDSASLRVRSASNRLPTLSVIAQRHPAWSNLGVRSDWAVLKLEDGPPLPVPNSRLAPMVYPTAVSLVGHYNYLEGPEPPIQENLPHPALRYPKEGFCQAIEDLSHCLYIACQTVKGFSGAPIFSTHSEDGSVEVVGFLSGAPGSDTGCKMNHTVRFGTFAVSADAVQLN